MEHSRSRMGMMGIARSLAPALAIGIAAAVAGSVFAPDFFAFAGPWFGLFRAVGLWWATLGLLWYLDAVARFLVARRKKRLAVRGTFAFCRHPIYMWWPLFVLPCAALLSDNYFFFLLVPVLLVLLAVQVPKEEAFLREEFPEDYPDYEKRTRRLLPLPRRRFPRVVAFFRLALFGGMVAFVSLASYLFLIRPGIILSGDPQAKTDASAFAWTGPTDRFYAQSRVYPVGPEKLWPWLVQVGYKRAGWYNIDAINAVIPDYFYEGGASAARIVPELQDLKIGDTVTLAPGLSLEVASLVENREMTLVSSFSDAGNVAGFAPGTKVGWGFYLEALGENSCKLTSLYATSYPEGLGSDLMFEIFTVIGGGLIQQPAMLYGLERRVAAE